MALRKVRTLLEYDAKVEIISPELCPELISLHQRSRIRASLRAYQPGDLSQATLAFAATGNEYTNKQVEKDAKKLGIPVNISDDVETSSFIVPSSLRRGEIAISVSTNGVSPALARKIRTRLEESLKDEYTSLVKMVGEVRAELISKGVHPNNEDWQQALDVDSMLELLKKGERKTAKATLLDKLRPQST